MQLQSKYRSKLYRDFRAIEPGEWRKIARYYEAHEEAIKGLDFEEHFEMITAYTKALFEIGAYEKHIRMADAVIEESVMNNVKFFHGEDIFHQMLFKKAASCYHTWQLDNADYILRELLRIDPWDKDAALFLKKCLRKSRPLLLHRCRAAMMLCFLLGALIVCVEFIVVRNFYPSYTSLFEVSRNVVFLSGIGMVALGEMLHWWRTGREVERFAAMLRRRKATRKEF